MISTAAIYRKIQEIFYLLICNVEFILPSLMYEIDFYLKSRKEEILHD